jgi:hypothetical protein
MQAIQSFEQSTLIALGNVSGGIVSSSGSPIDFLISFAVVRLTLYVFYRLPTTPRNEVNLFILAFIFWAIGRALTFNHDWYNPSGSVVSTQTSADMSMNTAKTLLTDVCMTVLRRFI